MVRRVVTLAAAAAVLTTAAATRADGEAHTGDTAAAGPRRAAPALSQPACPLPARFRSGFETAARDSGLPLALLVAVAEQESGMRPDAVSPAGAQGLLQLMPATAAEIGVNAAEPRANVLGGARYLRLLLDRFQSADLALAAYNAGPTAVARAGGAPTGGTLAYVADVTARWRALTGCR